MKKNIKIIFFVLLTIVICVFFFLSSKDLDKVIETLKNVQIKYLLIGLILVLTYLFLINESMNVITRKVCEIDYFTSHNIANSMNFYNGVTPFQSGGQPFQIYYFHKKGIEFKKSSSIVMMNFIIYQLSLLILCIVAMILYFDYLLENVNNFVIFMIIGLVINTSIFVGLILLSTVKSVKNICKFFIRSIGKIKIFKKTMINAEEKIDNLVMDFQNNFKFLFKNIRILVSALLLKLIALCIYYFIPFISLLAVGVNIGNENIAFVISMTVFAVVFMSYIPTPGASGGAEWAFKTIITTIPNVSNPIAVSATLIWRFLTYYSVLLFGLISVVFLNIKKKTKEE